jgi:N4-gp56 family major capsid protein
MSTTTTILPPPVAQRFSAKLLSTPQARLIHRLAAVPYRMPENSGNILRMRRFTRLETAPVPVNPAMLNPPAQQLTAVDIDARLDWYGKHTCRSKTFSDSLGTLKEAA